MADHLDRSLCDSRKFRPLMFLLISGEDICSSEDLSHHVDAKVITSADFVEKYKDSVKLEDSESDEVTDIVNIVDHDSRQILEVNQDKSNGVLVVTKVEEKEDPDLTDYYVGKRDGERFYDYIPCMHFPISLRHDLKKIINRNSLEEKVKQMVRKFKDDQLLEEFIRKNICQMEDYL